MRASLMQGDDADVGGLGLSMDTLTEIRARIASPTPAASGSSCRRNRRCRWPRSRCGVSASATPVAPQAARRMWLRRAFILVGTAAHDSGRLLRDVRGAPGRRRHGAGMAWCSCCSCCCSPGSRSPSCRRWRASWCCCSRRQDRARHRSRRAAAGDRRAGTRCCCRPTTKIPIAIMARLRAIYESVERDRTAVAASTGSCSATPPIPRSGSPRKRRSCSCAAIAGAASMFYRHRPRKHRAQIRQYRGLGQAVRRRLRLHDHPRRRQPDDRRHHRPAGRRRWSSIREVGLIQTLPIVVNAQNAVRAPAAIRRPALRPADRRRHRLVARLRRQLLGPQRHHPRPRLCGGCRPARTDRPQAVRRPYPQPRFRRGGLDAARRLGDPDGADARRQLRGMPAVAAGFRRARPALVPGQSAASGACCPRAACTGCRGCIC